MVLVWLCWKRSVQSWGFGNLPEILVSSLPCALWSWCLGWAQEPLGAEHGRQGGARSLLQMGLEREEPTLVSGWRWEFHQPAAGRHNELGAHAVCLPQEMQ